MELFTVHFTMARVTTHYDSASRPSGTEVMDIPHTIHALPYGTTLQYKDCKNFRREVYAPDQERGRIAHNSRQRGKSIAEQEYGRANHANKPAVREASLKDAAASGDMSAAINLED